MLTLAAQQHLADITGTDEIVVEFIARRRPLAIAGRDRQGTEIGRQIHGGKSYRKVYSLRFKTVNDQFFLNNLALFQKRPDAGDPGMLG